MYPSTLQPSVHHNFPSPASLFSFFNTSQQQQQHLLHHHHHQQQTQLPPFQPQPSLFPPPLTLTRQDQPQQSQPPPQQQQQQRQGSKIQVLISPPISPTRQVPLKKQLSLKYHAASAGSSTMVVVPSPPAVELVIPTRRPETIEEEEAMVVLQNISKQKSPTPPPATIAVPISACPSPMSPTRETSSSRSSAFSVVSSPTRSGPSGVSGLVGVKASPSPSRLEKSPGTPAHKTQRRLPKPKRLAYDSSPNDELRELVIDQEDEESERADKPTNKRQGRKKAESGTPARRRNSKTLQHEEVASCSKRRRRDEDDDYELEEDEDEEDEDDEFQAPDDSDSDREFHIRTQKKSQTRKRTKVNEGEEAGPSEAVPPSPCKKGTNRGTQLGYLHNLGPELRGYLASWLSRHTTVEASNSDPLYRCVKCTPPAGEQTKVSSSDRHKPGRVRIAIPQHLRKPYLPEKILAYHASSALFGQLPSVSEINNGLVASHRCGHSWCVAAHHLVWEPLGAKLARERGKQSCLGGDSCRHGPLRCLPSNHQPSYLSSTTWN